MAGEDTILDLAVINDLRTLDTGEGISIIEELGQLFLKQVPADLLVMDSCVREKNFSQIRKIAHRLKSSSASLGAMRVSRICFKLEKEATDEEIPALIMQMSSEFESVKPLLEAEMRRKS